MAYMGMRGTGDWVTDQRPKNYREGILRLYPNGKAPLTAIMSKMGSEKVDDPEFSWWTKSLPAQAADITGVYTDVGLSVAYANGGVADDTLYVKMSEAQAGEFRIGHLVMFVYSSDSSMTVVAKVIGRQLNGVSSYLTVKLLEADDNSSSYGISDADRLLITGNVNAEGSASPDAISYDPVKWYNYTQIWKTPLVITRTAMLTKLRTYDQYKESKRECLELHSIEIEKNLWFGIPTEKVGDNGKPERTTLGIIPAIRGGYTGSGGAAGTVSDFRRDASYSGKKWITSGEDWLEDQLEIMFRYGSNEKLAFCGSGALMAVNRLIKRGGDFSFTPMTVDYGIKITRWTTAVGSIDLITHPIFSYELLWRNCMVILEPSGLKWKYITDTMYKKDDRLNKGAWTSIDGIREEYLTEAGLEYHHPIGWGFLDGFGSDSAV